MMRLQTAFVAIPHPSFIKVGSIFPFFTFKDYRMASDSTVKGTLVFFLVGITELSPGTVEIVDIKKMKSSHLTPTSFPNKW